MNCLLDTSASYAFVSRRDQHHTAARAFMRQPRLRLLTTTVVVGETYTLLRQRHGYAAASTWLRSFRAGSLTVVRHFDAKEEGAIWTAIDGLAGVPLSYADGSLIVLSRLINVDTVFTFDTDFREAGLKVVPAV